LAIRHVQNIYIETSSPWARADKPYAIWEGYFCRAVRLLVFNCASDYAIRKVQEIHLELKTNGTYQLLVYADDVILLGDNRVTIKKNTQTLINASKEIGLEVNTEKVSIC
jgi:hypothetical protein